MTPLSSKAEVSKIIKKTEAFNMDDVLQRYAKDHNLPKAIVREHEREFKRYMSLIAINPAVSYGMKGPIDGVWHTFLLFTREYAAFCEMIAGRFIHHVPNVRKPKKNDKKANETDAAAYVRFLKDYKTVFGEEAPLHIWPRFVSKVGTKTGCWSCAGGCWNPGCLSCVG